MEPMTPRITKSTATAAIQARFTTTEELLKRFEVAKGQASLWDGERDGLREAVKLTEPGQYGQCMLSKSESSPVTYVNSKGKFHIEECLQCSIPGHAEAGVSIIAFGEIAKDPAHFLEIILTELQKGREHAIEFLERRFIGSGLTVDNASLYDRKGSEKATITVLP